jgi:XTP/dITP diphosphohydrolase
MPMNLVFATNNAHKLKEVRSILLAKENLADAIQVLSLVDIDCEDELPETASTFEGNALQKAEYVSSKFGVRCFADDSGLEVEALHGSPGIYSARYAGTMNSADNIARLLQEMKDEVNRKARFRTVIVSLIDGEQKTFEGIINGTIATETRGSKGFGYDPVFIPDGETRTFAEMSSEEKNRISHRALAIRELMEYLKSLTRTKSL